MKLVGLKLHLRKYKNHNLKINILKFLEFITLFYLVDCTGMRKK